MSKAHYLLAVERALRDVVLPVVKEHVARDSLASCLNVIVALRGALDLTPACEVPSFELAALPAVLRAVFEHPVDTVRVPDGLADDLAVRRETIGWIAAATNWLDAVTVDGPEKLLILEQLLSWERAQRAHALAAFSADTRVPDTSDANLAGDLDWDRLQSYFTQRFGAAAKITEFRRVMGGRSRQTALFSQEGVPELPRDLAVQRDPPVFTGVPGVEIQAPLLARVNAFGLRAPKPYIVESSRRPLGAPFMIVERLPGRPVIDATTDYFSRPPSGLQNVARSLAQQMAILHHMPIGDLNKILTLSFDPENGNWALEVMRLKSRLTELGRGPSIVVKAGISWLERNAHLIGVRWCVVHTDMLLHNLLAEGDDVTGVLDWEIAHIGHPGEDLGYVRPVVEQILPWPEFMAAYVEFGGFPLTRKETDFFSLYAGLRLLTLVQNPRALFENGQTNDLRLAETAASFIPQLIDRIDGILRATLRAEVLSARPSCQSL